MRTFPGTGDRVGVLALAGAIAYLNACGGTQPPILLPVTLCLQPEGISGEAATTPESFTCHAVDRSGRMVAGTQWRLRILNRDYVDHQIVSGPHPQHDGCPEFNGPLLAPEDSFTLRMTNPYGQSCDIHDEVNPADTRYHLKIVAIVDEMW